MARPPRIVFFGPPAAGTTALHRAVQGYGVGAALTDVAGPDGGRLLADPDHLPHTPVCAADAIVLTLDAADDRADLLELFRAFGRFLETLEEARAHDREVGGLPVFLNLTKCDKLWLPGDDPAEWERRVRTRLANVRREFEDFLADETPYSADPLAFGSLGLHTAATALQFPTDPRFAGLAGHYGVQELAERVSAAAEAFAGRAARSRLRLRWTLAGSGAVVGSLLAGLLLAVATGPRSDDRLISRLRVYQDREGPAAARLSDRLFRPNRGELQAIRDDYGFDELPADAQRFVTERLQEYDAYAVYRDRFRPPRLGPAEVRSAAELAALESALKDELAPPAEYAAAWADTEAGRLWAKWRTDAALLNRASAALADWYRGLIRRGTVLLLGPSLDSQWRGQAQALLAEADAPPVKPTDVVPGSPTLPGKRGTPLTYAAALDFDRVDQARFDWTDTRGRLTALRDLSDALGLSPGSPAVLELPEPTADRAASRRLAAERLRQLESAYRRTPETAAEWSTDRFPDPVRGELRRRLRAAFDTGVRHGRLLVREKLGADTPGFTETPDVWKPVAGWLTADPDMQAWGTLLRQLARWADPDQPREDPAAELAAFLKRDAFPAPLPAVELAIPDDLRDRRATPAGPLVLTHAGTEFRYRQDGEPKRDGRAAVYRFVPDGHPGSFVFRPGEVVSATLPVRAGDEFRLDWNAGRSRVYMFDNLSAEPTIGRPGSAVAERAAEARLTAAGLPAAPVLLPDLTR